MGVSTLRVNLSEADIRALIKGDTDEDRALACYRLCRRIDTVTLTDEERAYAEQILQIVVTGAAERVRRALAVTLKASPNLPPEIAAKLARDIESIAVPLLESSPVLNDEDLVEILESVEPARQYAIARRETLSETVTTALCNFAVDGAIIEALHNGGAEFNDVGMTRALDRFPTARALQEAMVERPILPVLVSEKLAARLTGELFDRLVEKHAMPPQMAIDLATNTRERAGIDLIAQAGLQADMKRYVQQLHLNGRLTPSFVLRALCQGEVRLVEYAFAELAGIPHNKAWLLVHDGGTMGLRAIFERANMPPSLYPAFRAAIEVLHETEFDGTADDRIRFRKRMIERVLTRFQSIPDEDLNYLLEKLDYVREEAEEKRVAVG
ncbi:MAG: DUF2336 domain-containing protein [Aquidulcibacter sp.]|uniref:DUF2336 domain-containing protein n=1 Tax=Aquidulcibacter sp. TaxID=2052990 RepID=UPI0022C4F1A6|nr:DUF2336 domain-containing protein [Aquidulcibacter sp.]MCZ8209324.1 DUF2336 domain-containing protein [Aquidulcibacter sp.]